MATLRRAMDTEFAAAPARSSGWPLTFKNLVFPIFCYECGARLLTEENGFFCPTCWELTERIEPPFCDVCGKPLVKRLGFPETGNYTCGDCRKVSRRRFRRIYAAAVYADAIAGAVKLLKFYDKRRVAGPLAEELRAFVQHEMDPTKYGAVVPVPLHRVRRRARGFNQAEDLATPILDLFPNARYDTSLRRIRPTRVQSRLTDERARARNVAGAFAVDAAVDFDGLDVVLVDDVATTGGTIDECAAALKRAGAAAVDALVVAIPVPDPDRMPHPIDAARNRWPAPSVWSLLHDAIRR